MRYLTEMVNFGFIPALFILAIIVGSVRRMMDRPLKIDSE
jgi:hypothetical protein